MNLNVITPQDATVLASAVKTTPKEPEDIAAEGQARPTGTTPQVAADDLYTKVVKYIPTPLIGLYLVMINLFLSGFESERSKEIACWITFGVFTILVVLFLRNRKVHRPHQIAVSVGAFIAWATASPGPFQLIGGWKEWIGTAALVAVSAIFVVWQVKPLPQDVLNESAP
jgi:hypothetical protein